MTVLPPALTAEAFFIIVVTAPTSNIGRIVLQALLASGHAVRVVARDPAKLSEAVRDGAEVAEGSHGDATVIDRALAGADALFWLAPPDPTKTLEQAYLDFTRPAVDAIRRHGVKQVVGITVLGRDTAWQDRSGVVTASIRMDDMLMGTGVAFRSLAMPLFIYNVRQQAQPI